MERKGRSLSRRRQWRHPPNARRATGAIRRAARVLGAYVNARSLPWLVTPLVALAVGMVPLSGGWAISGAKAASVAHGYLGRASLASTQPAVRHWLDLADSTTFTLTPQLRGIDVGGGGLTFTFVLPDSSQLIGQLTFASDPHTTPATAFATTGGCREGFLYPRESPPRGQPPGPSNAVFALEARVSSDGLLAYAHVAYLQLGTGNVGAFCEAPLSGTVIEMKAGCDLKACGQSPLETAAPAVATFDGAVQQAATSGDWGQVQALSAEAVAAQYGPAELTGAIRRQQDKIGRITAISPLMGPPQVQFDPAGQAYFAATQTVTMEKGGKTSTQTVTSYFILEGGRWLFWFSA